MGDHRVQCRVMGQQNSCKTLTGVHLTTHHVVHPNKGLAANMCMYGLSVLCVWRALILWYLTAYTSTQNDMLSHTCVKLVWVCVCVCVCMDRVYYVEAA